MKRTPRLLFACVLIGAPAIAQTKAPLPPLQSPQSVPRPAADTGQPYAPQAILPGGIVVPLFAPDSPYLKADKIHVPEVYNMSKAVPGRISSIVSIHNPSIEVHMVEKGINTGTAVIVIAGGGHRTLNVGGEGADFVPFFYNYGINTIILRNRLRADGYVAEVDAVHDAQQAVRVVRAYASKWGIDSHRIGVMGFSAGAELAAPAALLYEDWDKKNSDPSDPFAGISARPDFVGLIYPGPTPFARNRPAPAIPKDVPPAFVLCASAGDRIHAIWALDYYQAMLMAGVPNVELHLYGNGRHPGDPLPDGSRMSGGLTDRNNIPFGTWQYRWIDWVRDLGFLEKPGIETKAARDVASYVANPPRPIGQGRGSASRRGQPPAGGAAPAPAAAPAGTPPAGSGRGDEPSPAKTPGEGQATTATGNEGDKASVRRAIAYLDARQETWSRSTQTGRGTGSERTTCVSCHTGITYALARPALGRFVGESALSANEERMLVGIRLRVEHWAELDSPRFRLMYDSDARKKIESRGTEAVVNALILARHDAARGLRDPDELTWTALRQLWEVQVTEGDEAGAWAWLNFGLEPWEAGGSRAFGAALAAIAAGSAPRYLDRALDEPSARGVARLREYFRHRFPEESWYNRIWILEASSSFVGLLSSDQQKEVVDQLLSVQCDDGGWSLAALGNFERVDRTAQVRDADGYATGLVVHALHRAGLPAGHPALAKGLAWLRTHQQADGSWAGRSVNKERDPASFGGKLMTDAATAFAALALVECALPSDKVASK